MHAAISGAPALARPWGGGRKEGASQPAGATRLGGGRWTGRWTLGGIARVYGALASRASRVLIPALPSPARRPPIPHLVFLIYKRIIMLPPPPPTATQRGINE